MGNMTLDEASQILSEWLATTPDSNPFNPKAQKAALDRYGKLFAPSNIDRITEEDVKGFLIPSNNRHWSGLHRQQARILANMDRLRECLRILLDESRPIEDRLEELFPKGGKPYIKGLGKAVVTPILMCVFPEKYAVYNSISEAGLEKLGMLRIKRTDSLAKRYISVNQACHDILRQIGQPLYLVDSMFSLIVRHDDSPGTGVGGDDGDLVDLAGLDSGGASIPQDEKLLFPLEKFLREFLVANWAKTELGGHLDIYEDDQDPAVEYTTDVGRIDILAREKTTGAWVVIELKKGRDSDKVVGQLLRYMGWVKKHRAKSGENVKGVIITSDPDERIKYAISVTQGITFFSYRLQFDLVEEKAM